MADVLNLFQAAAGLSNTVVNDIDQKITKEAEIATRNKQYQLKYDLRDKMNEIRQSNKPEEWQTKIDDFFQQTKSDMMNSDSKYYCQNNLQGEMFDKILQEAQYDVSTKVNEMVYQANREKRLLDAQHSCDLISQLSYGQQSLDEQREVWKAEFDNGDITRTDFENKNKIAYLTEYQNIPIMTAEKSVEAAVKQGKTAEQFYEDVKKVIPALKLIDADGMEIVIDTTKLEEDVKRDVYSIYNAKEKDIHNQTERRFVEGWDNVQDQQTVEGRNEIKKAMRLELDRIKGTGLMSNDQFYKWTNLLKLEDSIDGTA